VVSIVHCDRALETQVREAIAAGATLVELRVDRIGDVNAVERLLRQPHDIPFILTIRTIEEGGAWDGDEAERIALFERLGLLLPGYIDIEYFRWRRSPNLRQKINLIANDGKGCDDGSSTARPKNALILSYHDLTTQPWHAGQFAVAEEIVAAPSAVAKAVFTPADSTDAVWALWLCLFIPSKPTIAIALGEAGLLTRVLAKRVGLFASYAAIERGAEAAPGQPTVQELRSLYRWDVIDRETRVYGVIGWPVAHSMSPALHNTAMSLDDINGVYLKLPVLPSYEAFAAFMKAIRVSSPLGFTGFSVTIPHKTNALRWLRNNGGETTPSAAPSGGEITSLAELCGAVNTLVLRANGTWLGDNTDVCGVWHALDQSGLTAPTRAAILGAGGVARAVAAALLERGWKVTIFNRTPETAEVLAREFKCAWRLWHERINFASDLLINCTSVGMTPHAEQTPFPAESLQPAMTVFDTVYTPARTRLLMDAEACGCRTISGTALFIGQAAAQYEIWHHRPVPCLPAWESMLESSPKNPSM
jgi:3-dehydroquinate dehydratase/shikimate dehydrogenase